MVAALPAAIATVPRRALITPLLATDGATKAARPFSATLMLPSLTIRASGFPGWSKISLPWRKCSSLMFAVVVIREPTSTLVEPLKTTPLEL